MNSSVFSLASESAKFLWEHKRVIPALVLFYLVTISFLVLCSTAALIVALLIMGQEALVMKFHMLVAQITPLVTPWVLFGGGSALFLGLMFFMLYSRICSAYYILHLFRSQPVTVWQTLRAGAARLVAAWRIVLGMVLFPCAVGLVALVLLLMSAFGGMLAAVSLIGLALLLGCFIVAIYFIDQLIADGVTEFATAVAMSWNFVKRSWWQLFGIFLILWVINMVCSFAFARIIFSLASCIVQAWYAVATNKIYMIARSESAYKYSSE